MYGVSIWHVNNYVSPAPKVGWSMTMEEIYVHDCLFNWLFFLSNQIISYLEFLNSIPNYCSIEQII
jgi:hypothetical protein